MSPIFLLEDLGKFVDVVDILRQLFFQFGVDCFFDACVHRSADFLCDLFFEDLIDFLANLLCGLRGDLVGNLFFDFRLDLLCDLFFDFRLDLLCDLFFDLARDLCFRFLRDGLFEDSLVDGHLLPHPEEIADDEPALERGYPRVNAEY
ncbi:hypothetical protein JCM19583_00420 [Halopiger thermotolerans]